MAKKTKSNAYLPHEEMMERFRKEGRVHREELSIKALTLDHRLQARDKPLDLDNVKALHAVVKDGLTLAPIVVFRIKEKNNVANGFHRVAVHKKEGLPSILADVVAGTWQEAVEYATCCNMANHALTPNNDDKKKGCWLLLDNGWESQSLSKIAEHVGLSINAVSKHRAAWCEQNKRPLPSRVVGRDGRERKARTSHDQSSPSIWRDRHKQTLVAHVGGRSVRFPGKSEAEVREALAERNLERATSLSTLSSASSISGYLSSRIARLDTDFTSKTRGLSGGVCRGFAVAFVSDDLRHANPLVSASLLVSAVGRVMLIAEHHRLARKVVLVFEPVESHETIVSLARRLGVEFMTLDQFVEVAKAEGDAAPLPDEPEFNEETTRDLRESIAGKGLVPAPEWIADGGPAQASA